MDKPIYEIPVIGDAPSRRSLRAAGELQNSEPVPSGMFSGAHLPPPAAPPAAEYLAAPTPYLAAPPPVGYPAAAIAAPAPTAPPIAAPAPVAAAFVEPAPVAAAIVEPAPAAPPAPAYVAASSPAPSFAAAPAPQFTLTTPEVEEVDDVTDIDPHRPVGDSELIAALKEVLLSGASDLHVSANAAPMIRIDGGLRPLAGAGTWSRDKVETAIRSLMTPAQQAQFESELELDFAYTVSANARFRVNVYQQRAAMGAAFRLIPTGIKQLHELGVPDSVARFAGLARGLVLVTGPTGSGKSTTLAALIDLVNRERADHIMTVEDPIEFLHANKKSLVNQREVGHDTHNFAAALKHVLRQDPDVILVGELRDLETISVALTAAETGHLVFATLHTQDAAQTIDRVIDVYPPHQQGQVRAQLAATLQGVVCQTLIKKASGRGRVVATEVLIATPAINNLIREGKTYQIGSSMQAGRDQGMYTMDQHLAELVNTGQITAYAAYEKCHDAETLKRLIHRQESPDGAGMVGDIDFGDSHSTGA